MPRIPQRVTNAGSSAANIPQLARGQQSGSLAREQSSDRQFNASQENARSLSARAVSNPMADGNLIAGVVHAAGTTVMFPHLLGRQAQGAYPALLLGGTSSGWAIVSLGTASDPRITAVTSQACTVDWWVF